MLALFTNWHIGEFILLGIVSVASFIIGAFYVAQLIGYAGADYVTDSTPMKHPMGAFLGFLATMIVGVTAIYIVNHNVAQNTNETNERLRADAISTFGDIKIGRIENGQGATGNDPYVVVSLGPCDFIAMLERSKDGATLAVKVVSLEHESMVGLDSQPAYGTPEAARAFVQERCST